MVSFTLASLLLGAVKAAAASSVVNLSDAEWTVSNGGNVTIPGSFPSQIHLDLNRAGIIEDPIYGFNDEDQLWVQRANWTWQSKPIDGLSQGGSSNDTKTQTWLVFEGLDTFAQIKMCGEEVANVNNMFRQYVFDVSDILSSKCDGSPDVSINFGSASKIVLDIAKTGPGMYTLQIL